MPPWTAPAPPPSAPDLHVWRTDLDAAPLPAEDDLAADERERAARAPAGTVRRHVLAGRWALRRVLAGYAGTTARALELNAGEHGKPALAGGPHFNVTHTASLWLVVVSADRAVGIDAEAPRDRGDLLALARHGLTAGDRERLAAAPQEQRSALFHRLWVRREATVKCHGTGLGAAPGTALGPVTITDADLDGIPVAVAAAGAAPVTLRWFELD